MYKIEVKFSYRHVVREVGASIMRTCYAHAMTHKVTDEPTEVTWVVSVGSYEELRYIHRVLASDLLRPTDFTRFGFLKEDAYNLALEAVTVEIFKGQEPEPLTRCLVNTTQHSPRKTSNGIRKALGVTPMFKNKKPTEKATSPLKDSDIVERALARLGEEASEVSQEVFKCIRFGATNTDPRVNKTNLEKLETEMLQLNMLWGILQRVLGRPYESSQEHLEEYQYHYQEIMTGQYKPRESTNASTSC